MLAEAKKALRVSAAEYDGEIARLIMAGARDLETAGVILPGTVELAIDADDAVTDASTLTDPLVVRAIITYVRMNFGSPGDYARVAESYELQKAQLMYADGYTNYSQGGDLY